jgi:hypothetical protein
MSTFESILNAEFEKCIITALDGLRSFNGLICLLAGPSLLTDRGASLEAPQSVKSYGSSHDTIRLVRISRYNTIGTYLKPFRPSLFPLSLPLLPIPLSSISLPSAHPSFLYLSPFCPSLFRLSPSGQLEILPILMWYFPCYFLPARLLRNRVCDSSFTNNYQ